MWGCIEGFRFAERMGIAGKAFEELFSVSMGNSWVVEYWDWFKML